VIHVEVAEDGASLGQLGEQRETRREDEESLLPRTLGEAESGA
jgi:hypothetical protein